MLNIFFILACCFIACTNCINLCGDWTQYEDIKCVKVLDKKGTEEEALSNCSLLEKSSTLITIHNKEEQEFFNKLVEKYSNLTVFTWIGLKYTGKSYDWLDGTETNYVNWADDAIRDGSEPCVQMSSLKQSLGKWTDESCKKSALIVCQKKPEFSLNLFKNILDNLTYVIDKQQQLIGKQQDQLQSLTKEFKKENQELRSILEKKDQEFKKEGQELRSIIQKKDKDCKKEDQELKNEINSMIPLWFLYTQYPNQSSPQQLWPNMKWSEVTSEYAGLFFRAEGGGSEKFGATQSANQSWISNSFSKAYSYDSWSGTYYYIEDYFGLKVGEWIDIAHSGAIDTLRLFMTKGEVRPRNTAIKIWKRIQ